MCLRICACKCIWCQFLVIRRVSGIDVSVSVSVSIAVSVSIFVSVFFATCYLLLLLRTSFLFDQLTDRKFAPQPANRVMPAQQLMLS